MSEQSPSDGPQKGAFVLSILLFMALLGTLGANLFFDLPPQTQEKFVAGLKQHNVLLVGLLVIGGLVVILIMLLRQSKLDTTLRKQDPSDTDNPQNRRPRSYFWHASIIALLLSVLITIETIAFIAASRHHSEIEAFTAILRNTFLVLLGAAGLWLAWKRVTSANVQAEAAEQQAKVAFQQAEATATQINLIRENQERAEFQNAVELLTNDNPSIIIAGIITLQKLGESAGYPTAEISYDVLREFLFNELSDVDSDNRSDLNIDGVANNIAANKCFEAMAYVWACGDCDPVEIDGKILKIPVLEFPFIEKIENCVVVETHINRNNCKIFGSNCVFVNCIIENIDSRNRLQFGEIRSCRIIRCATFHIYSNMIGPRKNETCNRYFGCNISRGIVDFPDDGLVGECLTDTITSSDVLQNSTRGGMFNFSQFYPCWYWRDKPPDIGDAEVRDKILVVENIAHRSSSKTFQWEPPEASLVKWRHAQRH